MRVRQLEWTFFRIPFHTPFVTAHTTFSCRKGAIIRLTTDTGIIGVGEASPLPRDDTESFQLLAALLEAARRTLSGQRIEEIETYLTELKGDHHVAAVRCALDMAACDALAQAGGVSVAEFLAPHAHHTVEVNAAISMSSTIAASQAARQAQDAGFRCIKLKVGSGQTLAEECGRVAAVRAAIGPHTPLRLDANGAWHVEQAICTIRALETYNLEFVEQPVSPGQVADLRQVREAVNTPIAADEDITSLDAALQVLQNNAAQILVLKPMVVGGLRAARRIMELARTAGAAVVVTTSLDTGIGAAAALHLAATLPPDGLACGLATSALLVNDLLDRPLTVRAGRMSLPDKPGLGVELDTIALQHYGATGA